MCGINELRPLTPSGTVPSFRDDRIHSDVFEEEKIGEEGSPLKVADT